MKVLFMLGALGLVLSACNTMEGLGQDIKAGGKKLESTAAKNK